MLNILAKRPQATWALVKLLIRQVFTTTMYAQGAKRGRAWIAPWRARYPVAIEGVEQDLEACLVYLKFLKE